MPRFAALYDLGVRCDSLLVNAENRILRNSEIIFVTKKRGKDI